MDRFAVLVDAGYLLSQSVQILTGGQSKARKDVAINDPAGLVAMIADHAASTLNNPNLLRVYWYDGMLGKLSSEQETLSMLPDVQLRPGIVNRSGVQKGVDSKIMADLMELSANHAISDVALVTGDGDLIIGIEMAQKQGVRVALLGLEEPAANVSHNQSLEVVSTADRVCRIGRNSIAAFLHTTLATEKITAPKSPATATAAKAKKTEPTKKAAVSQKKPATAAKNPKSVAKPKPPEPKAISAVSDEVLLQIIESFIAKSVPLPDASSVTETGAIGPTVDGKLLQAATAELTRKPMPNERSRLRTLLRDRLLSEAKT